MTDHNCDMCLFFTPSPSFLDGTCSRYREEHFPTDGAHCIGFVRYDDPDELKKVIVMEESDNE